MAGIFAPVIEAFPATRVYHERLADVVEGGDPGASLRIFVPDTVPSGLQTEVMMGAILNPRVGQNQREAMVAARSGRERILGERGLSIVTGVGTVALWDTVDGLSVVDRRRQLSRIADAFEDDPDGNKYFLHRESDGDPDPAYIRHVRENRAFRTGDVLHAIEVPDGQVFATVNDAMTPLADLYAAHGVVAELEAKRCHPLTLVGTAAASVVHHAMVEQGLVAA